MVCMAHSSRLSQIKLQRYIAEGITINELPGVKSVKHAGEMEVKPAWCDTECHTVCMAA